MEKEPHLKRSSVDTLFKSASNSAFEGKSKFTTHAKKIFNKYINMKFIFLYTKVAKVK